MREIKFRAWDKIKQTMKYPVFIDEIQKECPSTLIDSNGSKSEISDVLMYDYYIPMQYTGLKDKKGKEIYEGDIFTDHNNKGYFEVIYLPENTCFIGRHLNFKIDEDGTPFLQSLFHRYEIIGNIHENPELLI